ncbi:ABC transporter substrate-binding protein [Naasia lichenicola]|uniref:Amino acid-binding protein n=1 Tax=Naasia lichenicola TaxID=2565933 RepID=A0A4S4FJ71_9MICO|nr:ABC transporter substrate-binding protein [Naasia lichenicola]THG29944.1 amino acid-binding protein [Naasia lichenicola]
MKNSLKPNKRVVGTIAVLGVLALTVTGCTRTATDGGAGAGTGADETAAPSPGITDTTLSLGISSPLSGPTAGPGSCSVAGLDSYLEAQNAAGGFEFGDGKTREVTLTYLDDTYDPAKTVSNFKQLVGDGIFAYVGALGTPTNAAIMPIANSEEVPQVLLVTGATAFSEDQKANPWTFGLLPTYYDEANTFGKLLADAGKPITVAVLSQNDDFGKDYVAGLTDAIEGSDVTIVDSATYEPTDTTLDSQVTQLAASKADVLMSAVSVTPLQVGVLTKAQSIGWLPRIFLPSNTSTPGTILEPGGATAYPAVYSTSLTKVPASPTFAEDEDVKAYNAAFAEYGSKIAAVYTPHCAWSYAEGAILGEAFKGMEEPTRDSFMTALKSIKDFQAPLLLDGITVDTTRDDQPAISGLTLVQASGPGYAPAKAY